MLRLSVLLVDFKSYYRSPALNLGLLIAYAQLDQEVGQAIDFRILECPRTKPIEEIADEILRAQATLVGIGCYAWNHKKVRDTLALLARSGAPLPRILLGGPNSAGTFGDSLLQEFPMVSALVEGEGEPAFRDICRSLVDSPAQDPFARARNCVTRGEGGAILRADIGHRIQSLDEIPSPYLTGILAIKPSPIFYETNRGCPYRCSFCYWGNGNSKVYRMPHERIREEMELFARQRVSSFWIADANFGIFRDDLLIAEMMVEINARHGHPFKHVGVNWAKESNDSVLQIAKTFRAGRMSCTTTLALQSVTPEAGRQSQRYSLPAAKFTHMIRSATEADLDTYTDIIWGLPGESVSEFLDGLDAVISTGVPAILIHQLYLLPGTEFWDRRLELGIRMISDDDAACDLPLDQRSPFWDYIVVSHPKMDRADLARGARFIGISHLLHNHHLGVVPDFFLGRFGVRHRDVYEFFERLILDQVPGIPANGFLARVRRCILRFADNIGLDEFEFYREVSELVWLKHEAGAATSAFEEVREFVHAFYQALLRDRGLTLPEGQADLFRELVDYGLLIAPRPAWSPAPVYPFRHDVHALWEEMYRQVLAPEPSLPAHVIRKKDGGDDGWDRVSSATRRRLDAWFANSESGRPRPVEYALRNPWAFPPSKDTAEWLLSTRSKRLRVEYLGKNP